jgi:nucleotide-binding universal stress UspA family protein
VTGSTRPSTGMPDPLPDERGRLPFEHIACCIDDSEASAGALAEAERLRALSPGKLTVIHVAPKPLLFDSAGVVSPKDTWSRAHDWHAARVASVPGALGELLVGDPPSMVCEWVRTADVDLVVAAPHHERRERWVLGSFSSYLVRHAPTSVLLVRGVGDAPASTPYRHIACCVDRSDASMEALQLARLLRSSGPGRLTALTAAYLPPPSDLELASVVDPTVIAAASAAWLRRETSEMPDVEPEVVTGYPPAARCEEWASENMCDLLVAAAHRGLVDRVLLGSFADHLAHHAPCSVLLKRPITPRKGPKAEADR